MKLAPCVLAWVVGTAFAGQVPGPVSAPEIPITHRDRVYAAEQFSNTVSVTDAADNTLLGVIRLGEPSPGNFSPLYRGQLLVHGAEIEDTPDDGEDAILEAVLLSQDVRYLDELDDGMSVE